MDPFVSVEENYYWEELDTELCTVKCYLIKNWYRISGEVSKTFGSKEQSSQEKLCFSKDLLLTPIEDDCTGLQKIFYQNTAGVPEKSSSKDEVSGTKELRSQEKQSFFKILFKRQAYETAFDPLGPFTPKPTRLFKEIEYVMNHNGIYVPLKSITYNGYSQENNYQTVEYDSNGNRTIKRWFDEFNLQTQFCIYKGFGTFSSDESSCPSEEYYGISSENKIYLKLKILYKAERSSPLDFYNKKVLSVTHYDEYGDNTKELRSKMGSYQFIA
jgi:hypothetical protein